MILSAEHAHLSAVMTADRNSGMVFICETWLLVLVALFVILVGKKKPCKAYYKVSRRLDFEGSGL